MSSYEKKYTADFFKKDGIAARGTNEKFHSSVARTDNSEDKSNENETPNDDETSNGDETRSEDETSSGDDTHSEKETTSEDDTHSEKETTSKDDTHSENETSSDDEISSNEDEPSCEDETRSDDEMAPDDEMYNKDEPSREGETRREGKTCSEEEIEMKFNSEDKLISILYRRVVDAIMDCKNLKESTVDAAIADIKLKLHKAHKRGYRNFLGIDFSKHENCCGYLRRYAICHTGLVKRMMWTFFTDKSNTSRISKTDIVRKNWLKVVSLGGGPGNDLVGFCSSLQEIPNYVEKLELTVVDIGEAWRHVFPEILRKAADAEFGSLSHIQRKKIITRFIKADLTNDAVFSDANLSSVLEQADVLLMVKLISFLPRDAEPGAVIHNVIDSMKPGAKFIFIDHTYDGQFFREIKSLDCIYRHSLKYELCFKPKKLQSPSIADTFAQVAIYEKKIILVEDSPDSEES